MYVLIKVLRTAHLFGYDSPPNNQNKTTA